MVSVTCRQCGATVEAKTARTKFCRSCTAARRLARSHRYNAERREITHGKPASIRRKGFWMCEHCRKQKPHADFLLNGNKRRICRDCRNVRRAPSYLPQQWRVPFQVETSEAGRIAQDICGSDCYVCKHLKTCRANVDDWRFNLPCWSAA